MLSIPLPIATLTRAEHQVRERICPHCSRQGGRGCERNCPIFRELPSLLYSAGRLDPMVADRGSAIRYWITQLASAEPGDSPLARHRRRLRLIVEECVRF